MSDSDSTRAGSGLISRLYRGDPNFAFTLGLSTIIDLVVVFLFTHPIVSALAGTKLFTHPRMSGLGEIRSAPRVTSALRTKES